MGACSFVKTGEGKTPEEVFKRLVERDLYEYGNDPYSGTIGQKDSFTMVNPILGKTIKQSIEHYMETKFYDKWGDAGCMMIESKMVEKVVEVQKPSTRVQTKDISVTGVKWVTSYVLYGPDGKIIGTPFATKTEAKKFARKYVLKHNVQVTIKIEKHLANRHNQVVSVMEPIKNKAVPKKIKEPVNRYVFFGYAAE